MAIRIKKTIYREWHRALFRLQETCGAASVKHCPAQTVFLHVPKSAGSSVTEYFACFIGKSGSDRFVKMEKFRGGDPHADVSAEGVQKARNGRFVTGHFDWHTLEAVRQPHAFVFTFLRDPAARLLSLYHYLHHIDENTQPEESMKEWFRHMKSLTLEEFFSSNDSRALYETNNFMVRQFSGQLNGGAGVDAPFETMLEQALRNLETLNYVGFQETFTDDFAALVKKTGFPQRLMPAENMTHKKAAYPGARYAAKAKKEDVLALAGARIKCDAEFYRRARARAPEINSRPYAHG